MKFLCNSIFIYFLAVFCRQALAFQATASDFKFVINRKQTRANRVLSSKGTTIKATFQGTESSSSSSDVAFDENSLSLLNDAIGFNVSAADSLLSAIEEIRKTGNDPQKEIEVYLNNLLAYGPDASLPFWCKPRKMARFSRRARMACLKRTLDMSTPNDLSNNNESGDEQDQEDEERRLFRRRRALVALLRSLSLEDSNSKVPAIVRLERRAREASREGSLDLKSRLPDGLETPDYEVLMERTVGKRKVEIRRYKPYSVCSVSMGKPRPVDSSKTDATVQMPEVNGASSFGALAGYLFGKNDKSTAMKMTTPVFTSPGTQDGDKEMEFVMPSEYWDAEKLSTAPQPLTGSGVTLKQRESQDRAVLMFGGYASKKEVVKRKKELLDVLSKDSQWKIAEEDAYVAQYNDPFTVPWKRLNEVSILVVERNSS